MSGFTITLDALVAIVVMGIMVAATVDIMGDKEYVRGDYILRYGYDFITVADKSGALGGVIERNSTMLRPMIKYLPESICIELDMFLQDGSPFYHAQNFCPSEDNYNVYKVSRIILHGGQIYPTTVSVWYG
jgi:hypothetical protein